MGKALAVFWLSLKALTLALTFDSLENVELKSLTLRRGAEVSQEPSEV